MRVRYNISVLKCQRFKRFCGTYLQLFISHNRGCQYYLGEFDRTMLRFIPKKHGRLAVADNALFAPEAVKTPDGRLVMLCWMRDNLDDDLERELEKGWSGVYCLPRELCLGDDGNLFVRPLRETESLRYRPQTMRITGRTGLTLPLQAEIVLELPRGYLGRTGVIFSAEDGEVTVELDAENNELIFDTRSCTQGRRMREAVSLCGRKAETLRVFADGCIADAFAGGKALTRQFFISENRKITVFADGEGVVAHVFSVAPTSGL